jgi:N6-adenosine-specific RNA methylase IME4
MLVKNPTTELNFGLNVPGVLTPTGWQLPKDLNADEWLRCGIALRRIEGAVQWWLGDWWAYGENRKWGEGEKAAVELGVNYGTIRTYASIARAFELSNRLDNLTFTHHFRVMAAPPEDRAGWLTKALAEGWSAAQLRRAIKHALAGITAQGKLTLATTKKLASVIYADPPWKYDNTGMEGAAVDHYPPMTCDELCAMPVASIAAGDAALFLWVTNPLLPEGMRVMEAWGFEYKTNFVWVKDKPMNSLGFYNRGQHELLLLGTRGSFLPEGAVRALPSSVIVAPKAEHSRKPIEGYKLVEGLYPRFVPVMRELFLRGKRRKGWLLGFGNQAVAE